MHASSSDTLPVTDQQGGDDYNKTHSSEKPSTNAPDKSSDAPDGGYGWVVVVAVFLINFNSWGINSSYGVFLSFFLSNNYFSGASYLDFAFVGGLSIGVAMLTAPLATLTTTKFGTKITLCTGIVFETLALLTAGSARQIWQLFLSQGACFGVGMGFLFVGSVGLVPQWFTTKRSLANGIVAAGSGIGALTYNLACNAIIERWGLPWAYRVLGICAFCANTFAVIIIRDRNKQVGARGVSFDLKLFKRWEFIALQCWGILSMLGYVILLFSLPNFGKSIGLTASQGANLAALLNLGQGLGRPPIGYFSDRIGRINMAAAATLFSGIFVFAIWVPANSYAVLLFYAILGGTVIGTYWATIAPVTAEVIGLQDLPSALSLSWLVIVLPTTFSEAIALEIVETSPIKYLGTQLFAGFMYIGAALCLIPLRGWKIRENERAARRKEKELTAQADVESLAESAGAIFSHMFRWKKV